MSRPELTEPRELARELDVDVDRGLSAAEAQRRLAADGPNELHGARRISKWRALADQFVDPLIGLLAVAVVVSVIAWIVEGAEGAPVDALVIAGIVALNAVLGYVQQVRAADAVAALAAATAATSTVLRDGVLETIPSAQLVRGDVLVLEEGDAVGADARIVQASSLRVAEASLTGESEPVDKTMTTLATPAPLGDRVNMVYRGTAVVQGVGRAIVTATGMDTEMGAIATMLDTTAEELSPLQREVSRIGRALGIAVIVIAIAVMLTVSLASGVHTLADFVVVLLLGVSLAVAAVPEGLPVLLSLVLAIGVQRLAKRNAIVTKLHSVETLGSATVICSDKTGTLTRNEMTIQRILTASGVTEFEGIGYRPMGAVRLTPHSGTDPAHVREEAQLVLRAGSLANTAQLLERDGAWEIEGDPTEAAFLVAAHKFEGTAAQLERYERIDLVPFTSDRKMMSTLAVHRDDRESRLFTKGAPDVLLTRCTHVRVGGEVVPLTRQQRERTLAEVESLSAQAYRTLGVAYRRGHPDLVAPADEDLEHDLVYAGTVAIIDPPREEAAAAIAQARGAGIRVVMITGDHPATATRIATDLGILDGGDGAVRGEELDRLDDAELRELVRERSVFARVAPVHKLRLVDALQANGQVVAMTGDGVNDAPAIKSADIGIAMGITGTEVTKRAARMILADDDFATIVAAVRQGRVIFDNIRKYLRYLLTSNMGEVLTVFLGVVFAGALGLAGTSTEAVVLPLLATQILWINLVTDSGPALAMGVDPEIDDVMARGPRGLHERAIDGRMWRSIIRVGVVMAAVTLLTIDVYLPGGFVEGSDSLEVARTAGFTTLVLAQLFNALNARSETSSAFKHLFTNRWLWIAIIVPVALQVAVVELPWLQVAFGTASLSPAHWAVCIALASVVLWSEEASKLLGRAITRSRASDA